MADAYAQAPVVAGAQLGVDVAQAVVAGVAAAELELGLAGNDVELVVCHQDFLRGDLEEAGEGGHRFARNVHEGQWLQQPDGVPGDGGAGDAPVVTLVEHGHHLEFARECLGPPEPGVVAGGFVFRARVAQADKKFNHS